MTSVYEVLRQPIITEKSNYQNSKLNQVVFEVATNANKRMIKDAVEKIFDVKVVRVNTMVMPAKRGRSAQSRRMQVRKSAYKKAIAQLAAGESIDIFEGVK